MIKQISSKRLSLFSIGRHSISLGFFILVFGVCSAFGQTDGTTASDTASVAAKVIAPISISNPSGSSIRFGTVIPTSIDGTVSVVPSPTGPTRVFNNVAGYGDTKGQAVFRVDGEPGAEFEVNFTENFALSGPGTDMAVSVFAVSSEPPFGGSIPIAAPTIVTIPSNGGYVNLYVGATLNVSADQVPGQYSGDFDVTVTYQ